jgi:uncharacterized protein
VIIRISDLPGEGLTIDDPAALAPPFEDPSWRLDRVRLRVSREGAEVVVGGDVEATVPQVCGRCLESLPMRVRAAVDLRFVPRPAVPDTIELSSDDFETDFYADDQLDLGAVVRTETTLALPMRPLCQADCRGLCPRCGTNLNADTCACSPEPPDPRLTGLRGLAARREH